MADLKIVSYNVRGLASPSKCSKLWLETKRLGAHILLLQETHFRTDSVPRLPMHIYNQWFLSNSPRPKSDVVAVAIHKNCPFIPLDHYADPDGRFVFLKGTLFDHKLTLVTLYAPNSRQLEFLDKVWILFPLSERGVWCWEGTLMSALTRSWIPPLAALHICSLFLNASVKPYMLIIWSTAGE